MERGAAEIRILLTRGRELLILRQRGDLPLPWRLPGGRRRPHESIAAAAGRCGQDCGGLLLVVRAALPPVRWNEGGRASDCHLVQARFVEQQGHFPAACETRWILPSDWIEYDFEPISRLLLTHYQSPPDAP